MERYRRTGNVEGEKIMEKATSMMNKFKEAVEKFYSVYKNAKERHDLRVETKSTLGKGCYIKIYSVDRNGKNLIVNEKEDDAAVCYEKATEALNGWKKRQDKAK